MQLVESFAGNRLKKCFSWETLDADRAEHHDTIRVLDSVEGTSDDDDLLEQWEVLDSIEVAH
jgi:hypothetical protein